MDRHPAKDFYMDTLRVHHEKEKSPNTQQDKTICHNRLSIIHLVSSNSQRNENNIEFGVQANSLVTSASRLYMLWINY